MELKDTMECFKECPRKEQFVQMAKEDISLEEVEKLYRFLQGEVPEGIYMKQPPKLSERQAFKIIWYLQEVLRILPDTYERCKTCGELYDIDSEGDSKHCGNCER